MRASGPYSDPIQTDLCVLFRLMPASVAEEHVEGIGAVLARIAERGSGSHFQIGILLDANPPSQRLILQSLRHRMRSSAKRWHLRLREWPSSCCGSRAARPKSRRWSYAPTRA